VPTFSVVIAAYEAAAFIDEGLESVLRQTVRAHEVVVCDDASTDDLETALAPYRDDILLIRKERGGVASARNVATQAASGEFVAILDADDAYVPERLEALGELAAARPDLDILSTDAYFELDGRFVGRFNEETPFDIDDQRAAILERCFCPWPALRRSRLLSAGGFDESLSTGSDWEALIRLIHLGCKAGLVDEPLYRYRVRRDSLTADRVHTLRDRVSLLEKISDRPGLRPAETQSLARSVKRQRRALLLTEAEAALRAGTPDARRRSLAVALGRDVGVVARLAGLGSALAPGAAARVLERRARAGRRTRLGRSVP
jgi:glycosyltransferase involved in cell wall biosynthesis